MLFRSHVNAPEPWRKIGPVHLVLTMVAVTATGYHWWLDGVVAVGLFAIGIRLHDLVADRRARRARRSVTVEEPVATG